MIDGKDMLAGNLKLLQKFNIEYPKDLEQIIDTIVVVAVNKTYSGHIIIANEVKEDAAKTIQEMIA